MTPAQKVVGHLDQVAHGKREFIETWVLEQSYEDFLGHILGDISRC
jgi:hypothetical protein